MGSPVAYINHDEQCQKGKSTNKSDGSELSDEETEKMQTNKLDKHKAWGSFWTPANKEATMASPQRKKAKQDKTADQLTQLMEYFFVPKMIDFIKFHCQSYIASPSIEHWILSFI
jgi:hypothetical protein